MKSRFRKLGVESLEGRSVLSTMVEADFNGDDYLDLAAITGPNTITVSLFDPSDGGYDVSAVITTPKNQPIQQFLVGDEQSDGDLDLTVVVSKPSNSAGVMYWMNNGDGTFNYVEPVRWKHAKNWV